MSRCAVCKHFHTGRVCNVTKVSGPAVDVAHPYRPEEHTGRTVTKCDCTLRPGE